MTKLNDKDYEFILELIDEAYANQMIVIEESGDSPEYDDKLRLDEIGRLHDTIQARLDRQLAIINKNKKRSKIRKWLKYI